MPFITTADGTEIFYKDWGPKDAQPIVQQLLFFVGWLLRKSYEGGTPNERVNLISQYSTIHQRNEVASQTTAPDKGGILSRLNPWRK